MTIRETIKAKSEVRLQDIKNSLLEIKEKIDLGIPARKLWDETSFVKRNLLFHWISRQRDNELSYNQIKDILNQEGVPTLSGRGRWDARTVHHIITGK